MMWTSECAHCGVLVACAVSLRQAIGIAPSELPVCRSCMRQQKVATALDASRLLRALEPPQNLFEDKK